jgi:hypothetical protein
MTITAKVMNEAGYNEALLGLSLSYYREGDDLMEWWDAEKFARAEKRARALAFKGGGHNKFLASIFVWVAVRAPRGWWIEYDTYKVATTANSASTMHTLSKQPVTKANFSAETNQSQIDLINRLIAEKADVVTLKMNLSEGYLQTRQICINYMTLQNIINQRKGHRLKFWDDFIGQIVSQVQHPDLIIRGEN